MKGTYGRDFATKLNIYVVTDMCENTGGILGFAYLPWCPSAQAALGGTFMDARWLGGEDDCFDTAQYIGGQCVQSGVPADCNVLTHEIGHLLGLYHTHRGVREVPTCSQCWEGSECTTGSCGDPHCDQVGDLCCDTPPTDRNYLCADDSESDFCLNPTGLILGTDFRNFMGYAPDGCKDHFTPNQRRRMQCWSCDELTGWMTDSAVGACTRSDGSCLETTSTCCTNTLGTFRGAGTSCAVGACCLAELGCSSLAQWQCASLGLYLGAGSSCQSQQYACCLQNSTTCIDTTQACCAAVGGYFKSPYTCATLPGYLRCSIALP